jgi:putative zinc finger/helix-turn-helix YgiT family protein
MMSTACPMCGAQTETYSEPVEVPVGRWTRTVSAEGHRCSNCGETFRSPEQLRAAMTTAAKQVREARGLISPDRIRALRERHRLTQHALERLLGVGPKTVARWERGTVLPSTGTSRFLETLELFPEVILKMGAKYEVSIPSANFIGSWVVCDRPRVAWSSSDAVSLFHKSDCGPVETEMKQERIA